jgi:hypothetical protein
MRILKVLLGLLGVMLMLMRRIPTTASSLYIYHFFSIASHLDRKYSGVFTPMKLGVSQKMAGCKE